VKTLHPLAAWMLCAHMVSAGCVQPQEYLSAGSNTSFSQSVVDGRGKRPEQHPAGSGQNAQAVPAARADRYDVIQSGAKGDGVSDDTAAIQSAFDSCRGNSTILPMSGSGAGVVEFPGNHTYLITKTVNAYDSCRIEGLIGSKRQSNGPPILQWGGRHPVGEAYGISSFTIAPNLASITFRAVPAAGSTVSVNGSAITFVNSAPHGSQVKIADSAAMTAKALAAFLNASNEPNIRMHRTYKVETTGQITFDLGISRIPPTLATSDPSTIQVLEMSYGPSSPPGGRATQQPCIVSFPVSNHLSSGDWIMLQGFNAEGIVLNRTVAQVTEASPSSFSVVLPFLPNIPNQGHGHPLMGTFTDHGTATVTSVALAFDSTARYEQEVKDITIQGTGSLSDNMGVGIYFGSRLDTGSRVVNVQVDGNPTYFGYDISDGGINVEFDKGWRADGAGLADIYWRVGAGDNFRMANGTANVNWQNNGAALMIDNAACQFGITSGTLSHVDMESDNFNIAPGLGIITLYDCGSDRFNPQFLLNLDQTIESEASSIHNPGILMSPSNDLALQLTVVNSVINGQTSAVRFEGLPAVARMDMAGANGNESLLNYSPSINSIGPSNLTYRTTMFGAPTQLIDDVNIGQLWQYGTKASVILYSDDAFKALPNATTVFAGQVIASPESFIGAGNEQVALKVVGQTGTTGTPNGGNTVCNDGHHSNQLICSSATDLSVGQHVNIGSNTDVLMTYVDATNPSAVVIEANRGLNSVPNGSSLTFFAPVVGSGVRNNCPGCRDGNARTAQAFCAGITAPSSTLTMAMSGAANSLCTPAGTAGMGAQVLMNTSGILSNLAVRCAHPGATPLSGVFTIWDLPSGTPMRGERSGVSSGISVTYGKSSPDATVFDASHTFRYGKGDLMRIQLTTQPEETLGDCQASFSY
jgi:hypothetical protein